MMAGLDGEGKHLLGMAEIAFKHCAEGAEIMERIIQMVRGPLLKVGQGRARAGRRVSGRSCATPQISSLRREVATALPLSYFHPSQ